MKTLVVALLSLTLCAPVLAADAPLPTRQTVATRLQALEKQDTLSETEQARRNALRDTLKFLDEADANREKLQQIQRAQREAPAQLEAVRAELADFQPYDASTNALQDLEIRTLVGRLTGSLDRLEALQESLASISSELINFQTLPEQTQTTLRQALQRQDQIRRLLNRSGVSPQADLTDAQRNALRAEQHALETRVELFQRELWSSETLSRLAAARQQLLQQKISAEEARIEHQQEVLNQLRVARTEKLLAEAQAQAPVLFDTLPALQTIADRNRDISQQIQQLNADTNDIIRRNIRVRTQLDRLRQTERNLDEQIELLRGSLILSRILYDTQKQLPHVDVENGLQERIKEVRLQQFQLAQQRTQTHNTELAAQQWLSQQQIADDADTKALQQAAGKLLSIQQELLAQLDAEMGRFLNIAIGLQVTQEQLKSLATSVRDTVRENSFWMPSNQKLDFGWWRQIPTNLTAQIQQWQWPSSSPFSALRNNLSAGIALLVIAAFLLIRRRHWKQQLAAIDAEIGKVRDDSQSHTPRALWLSLLLEAPIPLLLVACWVVAWQAKLLITAALLWRLTLLWLVLAVCLRLLRKQGIAERHFHWPADNSRRSRFWLLVFAASLLAPITLAAIEAHQPEYLPENIAAMLSLMLSMPVTALALAQLALAYPGGSANSLVRKLIAALVAALPLALVVATLAGYFYSSVKLSGRLIESFYLLLLWSLISHTAIRGLAVAARRLKFKRILSRRQARDERTDEGTDTAEAPPLDLDQVNQQSLRLLHLGLLMLFAVVFYLVWSDLLGTVGYLDSVTLWETSSGEGDAMQWQTISLGDVMTALLTLVITLMLARNLPGLLEVLILSRLALRPGSAYAITTLLSYVIMTAGVLSVLSSLGFAWSKLQWLVAALGVGLGFGLQEIFANFVSGLIILFERPARIGDVITIGDLSGTVSRIRIRATTITDFERKEIIVPNKSFVTDRLINWSLTDSITRITVTVGFAYGSDLDKARDVLLQAAKENSRVLADPEPQALFLSFGASTLDHELRVHVKEVTDRIPATDELNRRIDALCRENDLEIAFSQLDIHIRSNDGREACLTAAKPDPDTAA